MHRRKYRFRILDGSNARWYFLFLIDATGIRQNFFQIGADSSLLSVRLNADRLVLGPAMRKDIVIDFTNYPNGTKLYLANFADQTEGVGPEGNLKGGLGGLELLSAQAAVRLLEFRVVGDQPAYDPSDVPAELRPTDPVPQALRDQARRRKFEFDEDRGGWVINERFVDIDRPQ